MAFVPLENVPTGRVVVPESIEDLCFVGENGYVDFAPSETGGVAEVPVGKWLIYNWRISAEGPDGKTRVLAGNGFPAETAFEVREGEELNLDVGEPVTSRLKVTKSGVEHSFNETLTQSHKERRRAFLQRDPPGSARRENIRLAGGRKREGQGTTARSPVADN
ncbi:MAG: hypothetical protein ACYTAN_11985 [Planctomycetota bacterium]